MSSGHRRNYEQRLALLADIYRQVGTEMFTLAELGLKGYDIAGLRSDVLVRKVDNTSRPAVWYISGVGLIEISKEGIAVPMICDPATNRGGLRT
jgi:hypothetical protein